MSYDDVAVAKRHLERSHRVVERQRQDIARLKALGQPTANSEKMLALFERTHAIFEQCYRVALTDETERMARASTPMAESPDRRPAP